MRSPVLLLVFNRPEPTRRVLDAVRGARPPRLYVAADGPRPTKEGEDQRCAEVRKIFAEEVDWPCEVKTLFRERNLGCREAVSSAISWFFENEAEGVILEDDCVPAADFFRFCDLSLQTWRDEPRVMHIGGHVLLEGPGPADLQVSHLVPIWGWATWRRAWQLYDSEMTLLPRLRQLPLRDWFGSQRGNVIRTISKVHDKQLNLWGARWALTVVAHQGLSILPRVNLMSNIGFGADATNTDVDTDVAHIPVGSLPDDLKLPASLNTSRAYDEAYLAIINRLGPRIQRTLKRWAKAAGLGGD